MASQSVADLVAEVAARDPEQLRERQMERERAQRDAAQGRRVSSILKGDLGPVLKRWVSGTVGPTATRVRSVAVSILAGDLEGASAGLQSPLFGIPSLGGSPARDAILRWFLKGDHAGDLVLAVLGTAISTCAANDATEHGPVPLTRVLGDCAEAARETAMGQFITQVQGAKAMMRVRKGGRSGWKQGRQLDAIAGMLGGQARSALEAVPEDAIPVRGREVVQILTPKGETRRLELRRPSKDDWKLLEIAKHPDSGGDPHRDTWMTFAMMVLCAAQAEAGWFDLVEGKSTRERKGYRETKRARKRRRPHGLVLAEAAQEAIQSDLDKWVRLGFIHSPMIVPPQEGDYISVKHRIVAGKRRGPMGYRTDARGTAAWATACDVFAGTAWAVPAETLQMVQRLPWVRDLAAKGEPDEARRELIIGEYARIAQEEFYLPLFMDFRGRVYTRSNLVTCQGRDLQKSLMCFPDDGAGADIGEAAWDAIVLHMGALYGGPDKLDKAPLSERRAWFGSLKRMGASWEEVCHNADEPLQLLNTFMLIGAGTPNRIACQIDGTCNGLQHLSALFRDETAAPHVNLCGSTLEDRPSDIYAEVAVRVERTLRDLARGDHGGGTDPAEGYAWARRVLAAIRIDRKLCKKPVMVLPYGGTRVTIEDAVLGAILDQEPFPEHWTLGYAFAGRPGTMERWPDWVEGNYAAFKDRGLKDHPLLHLDAKRLGGIVWDCIVEVLPRPMAAMEAFRGIAKGVGERTLEWSTGFAYGDLPPLWVVQAKDKTQRTPLHMRGFALPGSVRGLEMRRDTDEIDPRAHVSGIVANFIHSQDAAHLARTMKVFRTGGGTSFGAIHDCLLGRPSEMALLGKSVRSAFWHQYAEAHPLEQPVRLRDKDGKAEEFASWYALAESLGVSFPDPGTWRPEDVLDSAWFFS